MMEVTFTRTGRRKYEVLVRRDDGVVLELRSFDRPARLPHDLAHFVVESELRLERGLWGLLAAGAVLPNMTVASGRLRAHAAERSRSLLKEAGQHSTEAEVLVGVIQQVAEAGLEDDWPRVSSYLGDAWRPRRSQRPPITREEVRRACRRLRESERLWEELPVGGALTVMWPRARARRPGSARLKKKAAD